MSYKELNVTHNNGRLSFSTRTDDSRPWWRDLDLDGKPLYRIGNLCDTCNAIFSRSDNANLPIAPSDLSHQLGAGLKEVAQPVIDTVAQILPQGKYIVAILKVLPILLPLRSQYAPDPSCYLWENNAPVVVPTKFLPKGPRAPRWGWAQSLPPGRNSPSHDSLYEAILPLIDEARLDQFTIDTYKTVINQGNQPTALALSVVDGRYPQGKAWDWQLMHFLLDGHHKLMAAFQLNKPITLLSFLAIDESFAPKEWITNTIQMRYG